MQGLCALTPFCPGPSRLSALRCPTLARSAATVISTRKRLGTVSARGRGASSSGLKHTGQAAKMRLQLALLAVFFALVASSSADNGRTAAFVISGAGLSPREALTTPTLSPRRHCVLSCGPSLRAGRAVTRLSMTTDLQDEKRLLSSRRLAAAVDVIKAGVPDEEEVR